MTDNTVAANLLELAADITVAWLSNPKTTVPAADLPAVIGLDASWTRDTSAVVFDQVGADGVHNWLAWIWRKDEALGYIDHDPIEAKIVELCEDFPVARIACVSGASVPGLTKKRAPAPAASAACAGVVTVPAPT